MQGIRVENAFLMKNREKMLFYEAIVPLFGTKKRLNWPFNEAK